MTTVSEIATEQKVCQFVKEYADDHCCLELILFFGRHPHTRFSRLAIVHASNDRKPYVEKALRYLIDKGVLKTYIENNAPLYSLNEDDETLRSPLLDLVKLDWSQLQLVLRQAYPTYSPF